MTTPLAYLLAFAGVLILLVVLLRWLFGAGGSRSQPEPHAFPRTPVFRAGLQGHDYRLQELESRVDDLDLPSPNVTTSDLDDLRSELEADLARLRERVEELERKEVDGD